MNNNLTNPILPPATIGIVGGGQLGQMLTLSAKAMGYQVGILDPTPQAPAGQVADFQIVADYDDQAALRQLAERAAVVTYEFENVDTQALEAVQSLTTLPQGTNLLAITGNRLAEKTFLQKLGVPVTKFRAVTDEASLEQAVAELGFPGILKTAAGGYDGHGQQDLNGPDDLKAGYQLITQGDCILEQRQSFVGEVAMMVTRSVSGQIQTFPLTENKHQNHILHTSIAPARFPQAVAIQAKEIASQIAAALELRGVLGIEFFVLPNQQLMVNELAPRPHNSGHFSIEACNISQFEAHIRSICGLPIPKIKQLQPAVMRNLLGADLTVAREALTSHPEWHFHDYGKAEIRPQRKLGHVTVLGPDINALLEDISILKGEH